MKTPLFSALKRYSEQKPVSYHVPGHKNGTVFLKEYRCQFQELLKIDVTELTGLDDLHQPSGVIAEAQELLKQLYKTEKSYFLVNGSTAGNIAMIMASCGEGDVVLVQRNSHKSIMNGILLAGAKPVFLGPEYDLDAKAATIVKEEIVLEALCRFPHAKALILTNPTYFGHSCQLDKIVKAAHEKSIPVLVDEAHGAHFVLGEPFPPSALKAGADVVIHSAHKTLPAMTMGSFLHVQSNLLFFSKIERCLSMVQSSSPSYPIMASLDLARAYLEEFMDKRKKTSIPSLVQSFIVLLEAFPSIEIVNSKDESVVKDPLRVSIRSTNGLTGFELQSIFEKAGIYPELANNDLVLFVLPLSDQLDLPIEKFTEAGKLLEEAGDLSDRHAPKVKLEKESAHITELKFSYKELERLDTEFVSISDAIGFIAAEAVVPYPPGIPYLMPGEDIKKEHVEYISYMLNTQTHFQGGSQLKNGKILIYKIGKYR
ncbi:aminotransferase class I/II-fold pyridoxal phosphate-dependent enzyme [Metabacillus arenae]|uniref:Aminotransferase class I/II-fold pyridoxal phosphate-dependent enzyme n=1 Tax=Metabacillus arenae TaxID=2771434 RepID=A0A926S0P9_9BACI|nr:aminotransferase class I/II-fold pyridoxal phosphate-dependent enzyme [Metabacillus arenae]MBD1383522.1 aminotransferase class I/II-fold pyridoxal phosphate-dependent enzyme [Metabacillus arenae]